MSILIINKQTDDDCVISVGDNESVVMVAVPVISINYTQESEKSTALRRTTGCGQKAGVSHYPYTLGSNSEKVKPTRRGSRPKCKLHSLPEHGPDY